MSSRRLTDGYHLLVVGCILVAVAIAMQVTR